MSKSRRRWSNFLIATGLAMLVLAGASFIRQTQVPQAVSRLHEATYLPATMPPRSATPSPSNTPSLLSTVALTKTVPSATFTLSMAVETTETRVPPALTELAIATPLPSAISTPAPPTPGATPTTPRLVIPKIGVNAGIVEVTWRAVQTSDGIIGVWDTVEVGVGHHRSSAKPGEQGNVVLSGHSREGGAFARLAELKPGDEILIYTSEHSVHRYVTSELLTLPEVGASLEEKRAHARYLEPTAEARLTLITCWPTWAYTHRLIVIAKPVP